MIFKGTVFKFADGINTDFIISGRYKFAITDMKELSRYLFEDIRPGFYNELKPRGSIIVAGNNFGMGSSREQAPRVIKEAGVLCVVAKSFARIFYRNAFNIGFPLIEADTSFIEEGDFLSVNVNKGLIEKKNKAIKFVPFDKFREELILSGGIVNYLKEHGGFKI